MSMLNFKYGSFAKLPADISNGTIYVTKVMEVQNIGATDQGA